MSIVRITVRTFQNEDHANLFLMGAKSVISEDTKSGLKLNSKIIQNLFCFNLDARSVPEALDQCNFLVSARSIVLEHRLFRPPLPKYLHP